jgi:hypothetical protein
LSIWTTSTISRRPFSVRTNRWPPRRLSLRRKDEEEVPENEDDALATEQTDEAEEGDEPLRTRTRKKRKINLRSPLRSLLQDRINEVVAKQRIAERERDALAAKLSGSLRQPLLRNLRIHTEEPKPLREQLADMSGAPNP